MSPKRYNRTRKQLQHRVSWGQFTLLGILVVSLINQLLLWSGVHYHFLCSAAMPYYLNWMAGQLFSTGLSIMVILVTFALYAVYGLCLLRSHQPQWFWTAMALYALDTVLLLFFALIMLENPMSCLIELLIHIVLLMVLLQSWKARLLLRRKSGDHP